MASLSAAGRMITQNICRYNITIRFLQSIYVLLQKQKVKKFSAVRTWTERIRFLHTSYSSCLIILLNSLKETNLSRFHSRLLVEQENRDAEEQHSETDEQKQ